MYRYVVCVFSLFILISASDGKDVKCDPEREPVMEILCGDKKCPEQKDHSECHKLYIARGAPIQLNCTIDHKKEASHVFSLSVIYNNGTSSRDPPVILDKKDYEYDVSSGTNGCYRHAAMFYFVPKPVAYIHNVSVRCLVHKEQDQEEESSPHRLCLDYPVKSDATTAMTLMPNSATGVLVHLVTSYMVLLVSLVG